MSSSWESESESAAVVLVGRKWERGRAELSGMWRLERVVRRSRVVQVVADGGRRLSSSSRSEDTGVVGGKARESVGGRPVPEKLVMRTLILLGAIVSV